MKTYWPDYYKDFHCKAGECRHTCCRGWIIEIDEKSLERFGKDPDIAHEISDGSFRLKEDERCPFLRDDNLCEMILKHGEDYLCDICREHPRFYDFGESEDGEKYCEAGIGLTCEEACRIILSRENGFTLVSEDGEDIGTPDYVSVLFDKDLSVTQRLCEARITPCALSSSRAEFFRSIEIMDPEWLRLLKTVEDDPVSFDERRKAILAHGKEFINFAAYLSYRYAYCRGWKEMISESVGLLADLVARECDVYEAARMFSSEIEYSDENMDILRRYAFYVHHDRFLN